MSFRCCMIRGPGGCVSATCAVLYQRVICVSEPQLCFNYFVVFAARPCIPCPTLVARAFNHLKHDDAGDCLTTTRIVARSIRTPPRIQPPSGSIYFSPRFLLRCTLASCSITLPSLQHSSKQPSRDISRHRSIP